MQTSLKKHFLKLHLGIYMGSIETLGMDQVILAGLSSTIAIFKMF